MLLLLLQALFLYLVVSALIIGGAMLFHRFFPNESRWFGFIIPALAVVALFNFIEHLVALPVLSYLLPVLVGATLWMAISGKYFKQPLILPTSVFLVSFAFTFGVRCMQPDIYFTSDGISDLNIINNYSQGETLPPIDTWMPPYRFEWYYGLQHYAAAVLGRLLGVKIGVADNVSHALLNALVCVTATAAAHRLSGGRIFAAVAMPFLIICSATGSVAYLFFFCHSTDLWLPHDLSTGMSLPHPNDDAIWKNPIWKMLLWDPRPDIMHLTQAETLRLQVPGFWTWRDEYHANASGHFLTILGVLAVAEVVEDRRAIWPWVLAVVTPIFAATASAWALPITVLLCWGILPMAWWLGRRPASMNATLWTLFGSVMLLWPAFYNVTSNPEFPPINLIDPKQRTPVMEFLFQWWPIILLWICTLCCFRRLNFGVRWMLVIVPLMLFGIEMVTIESRYNTVEKMWGYTWAVGLVGFFPIVASLPFAPFRILVVLLFISGSCSLGNQLYNMFIWSNHPFALDGTRYITSDEQKSQLLQKFAQTKHATYLTGKCAYCYNQAPVMTVFTNNRSYIAWSWFVSNSNFRKEAEYREKQNNDFYSGAMTDRLRFLQDHAITGVLIWPDDDISNDALAALTKELAPDYYYIDCKGSGEKNAGLFILRATQTASGKL